MQPSRAQALVRPVLTYQCDYARLMMNLNNQKRSQYPLETESDLARRFLLLCLQVRLYQSDFEKLSEFVEREKLNWDLVEQHIWEESLAPLIYTIISGRELVPAELEQRLHREFITRITSMTYQFHELWKILNRMQSVGINVILLKGAALSLTVYQQDLPRYFGDLDLLVQKPDISHALQVLAELDYAPGKGIQLDAKDLLPYVNEWQLTKAGHFNIDVDLHWHLFSSVYHQYTVPSDWFWETAVSFKAGANSALTLGPEANLIHLCAHLLQHQRAAWPDSMRLLHDIAELITAYQDQLDWDLIITKAEAYRLVIPVQQVLLRVWQGWQVAIPPTIREQLQNWRPSVEETRAFDQLNTLGGGSDPRFAVISLRSLPNWRMRIRYIYQNLLFPSTAYMQHRYQIRLPVLVLLYYPYRWCLGILNGFK